MCRSVIVAAALASLAVCPIACRRAPDGAAPDPLAALIRNESAPLEERLDAMDRLEPPAPQEVVEALLHVMKDRSHLAFVIVPDDSELGYHVEESPFGGPDTRAEVRWSAILALERLRERQALPDLLAALHDRHGVVRNHAARAAWRLGSDRGVEVLLANLEGRVFENETANRMLKEMTGHDAGFDSDAGYARKQQAIRRWREFLEEEAPAPSVPSLLMGDDPDLDRRIRFLVAVLGQHQFLFMEQARRTLSDLGHIAVEHVGAALDGPLGQGNPLLRAYAVQVLENVGDDLARRLLRRLLEDEDAAIRSRAADALGRLADAAGAPTLIRLLEDEDESVIVAAARALGRLGQPAARKPLARALRAAGASRSRLMTAAVSLLRLGAEDSLAREIVITTLESGPLHERAELLELLEEWQGTRHGFDPSRPGDAQPEALATWKKVLS